MYMLSLVEIIFLSLLVMTFLVKTIHFLTKIRRKRLLYWFHFDLDSIINSRSRESEKAKKLQNTFSVLLLVLILLTTFISVLKGLSSQI
jgi:hypothetical protein